MRTRMSTLSIAAALCLSMLASGSAMAVQKGTSWSNVWGCDGVTPGWCGYANFSATWKVTLAHSEGQTYYTVDDFEMYGVLTNGKNAWVYGVHPGPVLWNAKFKNSNGTTLYSLYPTDPGGCGYAHSIGTNSLDWTKCKSVLFDIPSTVTQVTVNFWLDDGGQTGTGWQKSWTVPLT